MAGSWCFLCHFCFEAFAALYVHCELLPSWKYCFQALSTPITHIVIHADDMIEVCWVVTIQVLTEWAERQLPLSFTTCLGIRCHLKVGSCCRVSSHFLSQIWSSGRMLKAVFWAIYPMLIVSWAVVWATL